MDMENKKETLIAGLLWEFFYVQPYKRKGGTWRARKKASFLLGYGVVTILWKLIQLVP